MSREVGFGTKKPDGSPTKTESSVTPHTSTVILAATPTEGSLPQCRSRTGGNNNIPERLRAPGDLIWLWPEPLGADMQPVSSLGLR